MWCYQIPEFEARVIAELQRQQQRSQFCDTLLKAGGVSIPAHSCVLSAISPCISSALAATSPPPAGQTHLLEFQSLTASSVIHVVQLLYSGLMMGEGDREKQEAITAAAKLGICGLVEVIGSTTKHKNQEEVTDVGVQTEPEEAVTQQLMGEARCRSSKQGEETPPAAGLDIWTQTEELVLNGASSPRLMTSYQTLDLSALQMEPYFTASHITPIPMVYPPDQNQPAQPSSAWSAPETTDTQPLCVGNQQNPSYLPLHHTSLNNPNGGWAVSPAPWTAEEHWENKQMEQFKGNISGFISYFLDLNRADGSRGRRPRRQRGRRGGTSERRPRGKQRGRGRGVLTQMVDVQEVHAVGRLQKLFMHHRGVRLWPKGQGGGAVGWRAHLKTRELLNSSTSQQRRRVRSKVWEVNQRGELQLCNKGRAGAGAGARGQRGRRSAAQLVEQASDVGPLPSAGLLQWPPSLPSAEAFCDPAAPTLLHTSSLPHTFLAPLSPADPLDHGNHLLEEVIMVHDIQLNRDQPPIDGATDRSSCSDGNSVSDQPQGLQRTTELVKDLSQGARSGSATEEALIQQQECEGEMNHVLEKFLQSFEQYVERHSEESVSGSISSTFTSLLGSAPTTCPPQSPRAAGPQRDERPRSSSLQHPACINGVTLSSGIPVGGQRLPLELMEKLSGHKGLSAINGEGDKLLRMIPVVKLQPIDWLPVRVMRSGAGCPNPRDQDAPNSKVKQCDGEGPAPVNRTQQKVGRGNRHVRCHSEDTQPEHWPTATRARRAITNQQPKQPQSRGKRRRSGSNRCSVDGGPPVKVCVDKRRTPFINSTHLAYELQDVGRTMRRKLRTEKSLISDFITRRQKEERKPEDEESQSPEERRTDSGTTNTPPESVRASADPTLLTPTVDSAGSRPQEDDVDVLTASSPVPDPVIICWSESSDCEGKEEEDQDIDVVGEDADVPSLLTFTSVSRGELVEG